MSTAPISLTTPPSLNAGPLILLQAPIVPLLLRMAWPNVLIMVAHASTGLIETWWISKLGTQALAGMALVFPIVMLITMISAGSLGGAISAAVARALGAGRQQEADRLVLHAIVINIVISLIFSGVFLVFGEQIYGAMAASTSLVASVADVNAVVGLGTGARLEYLLISRHPAAQSVAGGTRSLPL